jgi:hypothetical protein
MYNEFDEFNNFESDLRHIAPPPPIPAVTTNIPPVY